MLQEYEAICELVARVGPTPTCPGAPTPRPGARRAAAAGDRARIAAEPGDGVRGPGVGQHAGRVGAEAHRKPRLAHYRHYLEKARLYRPHVLSEPEEKVLAEKSVTGRSAWERYFGETLGAGDLRAGRRKAAEARRCSASCTSRIAICASAASASVTEGLRHLSRTSTYVFNNLLADKASDDRLRHYESWISARNLRQRGGCPGGRRPGASRHRTLRHRGPLLPPQAPPARAWMSCSSTIAMRRCPPRSTSTPGKRPARSCSTPIAPSPAHGRDRGWFFASTGSMRPCDRASSAGPQRGHGALGAPVRAGEL